MGGPLPVAKPTWLDGCKAAGGLQVVKLPTGTLAYWETCTLPEVRLPKLSKALGYIIGHHLGHRQLLIKHHLRYRQLQLLHFVLQRLLLPLQIEQTLCLSCNMFIAECLLATATKLRCPGWVDHRFGKANIPTRNMGSTSMTNLYRIDVNSWKLTTISNA